MFSDNRRIGNSLYFIKNHSSFLITYDIVYNPCEIKQFNKILINLIYILYRTSII